MNNLDRYDSLIRYYATKYKLTWHVIKEQLMAESSMNPNAISHMGAKGLGQFMPGTWKKWGKGDPFNPENSIEACCKYMRHLCDRFMEIPKITERYKFAMASYNAGRGNINDVLELARVADNKPKKHSDWKAQGSENGKWQEWDFAKEYLKEITGDHSEETINYIDKIMG